MFFPRQFALAFSVLLATACSHVASAPRPVVRTAAASNATANPWTNLNFPNHSGDFNFAVVTDRAGGLRPGIFDDAVDKLNLLRPDFAICVGDLVEGYTSDRVEAKRQRDEFDALVRRLDVPFFYVPGNHDMGTEPLREEWQRRFGRTYYHFVYRDRLFLCLNACDGPTTGPFQISQTQVDYAARALAENKGVKWTFVFMHAPFWVMQDRDAKTEGWQKIESLLKDRPYTVFAGHYHTYTKYERQGRNYYRLATTGGGSELRGPSVGSFDEIAWVTVTDKEPRLANLDLKGIYSDDLYSEKAEKLYSSVVWRCPPVILDKPRLTSVAVPLQVVNNSDLALKLQAMFQPSGKIRAAVDRLDLAFPAHSTQTLVIPLEAWRSGPIQAPEVIPAQLAWRLERPGAKPMEWHDTYDLVVDAALPCPRRKAPVQIDGRLDEWKDLPYTCSESGQVSDAKNWTGPADGSFRFAVAYDDRFIYVAAKVTDDRFFFAKEKWCVSYDGLGFNLDANPSGRLNDLSAPRGRNEGVVGVWANPGETMDKMITVPSRASMIEGVQVACIFNGSGYGFETAIPVSYVNEKQGKPWERFWFSIHAVDTDGPGDTPAQLWWRPSARDNASNYIGGACFTKRPR